MEIQLNRNEERLNVNKVTIFVNNTEFEISVNQFNELIINKQQYDNGETNIIIRPKVSNEIGLV